MALAGFALVRLASTVAEIGRRRFLACEVPGRVRFHRRISLSGVYPVGPEEHPFSPQDGEIRIGGKLAVRQGGTAPREHVIPSVYLWPCDGEDVDRSSPVVVLFSGLDRPE